MAEKYNIVIAEDNREEILRDLELRITAGLEAAGQQAVSYAKNNITAGTPRNQSSWYTGKGTLRNSIAHTVRDNTCYVGTNLEYAIYNEYGTGKYADGGKGRKGWWVFVPNSNVKGSNKGKTYTKEQAARIVAILQGKGIDAHMTEGIKPLHFLKNAIQNNKTVLIEIIKQYINKAT